MTITNSSTRLAALVAGVAVAIALMGAVAVAPAQAQAGLTSVQISAIVSLLASFGADQATINNVTAALKGQATPGSGNPNAGTCPALVRSLQLGSSGADVLSLQKFLNGTAATRVSVSGAGSPGMETTYFGPATQSAVIKFQAANNVSPIGVVGPATRAAIAATCGNTTPGTPGTPTTPGGVVLKGGEGMIDNVASLGDVDTSVDEGDNDVDVLGAEFDAKDSDVSIQRVDVDIKSHSGNGSSRLTNYVDSVSLILDGKNLATIDASDIDKDSNGVYSFRFSGLNGVVREDDTANLYVSFDVVGNMDSTDDADTWVVNIPQDGIRAVDAAGISDTYVTATESTDLTETVTFNTATGGTLKISTGTNNPQAGLVEIASTTDTNNVKLLEFKLKAEDADVTIHDFPIGIAAATGNVSLMVKRVRLMHGSTVLKTETISTGAAYNAVTFDNVDFELNKGDEETFSIVADIFDADSGEPDANDTLVASTTGALTGWDVEDSQGDTLTESTDITGSVGGNTQTFTITNSIAVTFKSASTNKNTGTLAGASDSVDFTIKFSVKNSGSDTIYFDGDVTAAAAAAASGGLTWATTTDSTTGTSTSGSTAYGTGIVSPDVSDTDDVLNSGDKRFVIDAGQTRDFTFSVTIPAGGDNVNAGVKITGFAWDTTSQDTMTNLYNFDLGSFKTQTVTGLFIQ